MSTNAAMSPWQPTATFTQEKGLDRRHGEEIQGAFSGGFVGSLLARR